MGEANTKGIWKTLFDLLFNNKEPDDELPDMWAQFKKGHLHRSEIRTAIDSFKDFLPEDVRKKFCELNSEGSAGEVSSTMTECSLEEFQLLNDFMGKLFDLSIDENGGEAEILDLMRKCDLLDDNFWRLLFTDVT